MHIAYKIAKTIDQDEKYNIHIEMTLDIGGTDYVPDIVELKYAKAGAGNKRLDTLEREARDEMRKYMCSDAARAIPNLQPYILIFRKDRCARKIRFEI